MYETQREIQAFFKSLFQYRYEKKLGEGGFGSALLAFDETEQRLKVFKLPKDEGTTNALKTEGENLVKLRDLQHKNIIQLHQFGRTMVEWEGVREERFYLLLAYGGTSLRHVLGPAKYATDENGNPRCFGSGKRLPLDEVLRISIDVCEGLVAAHGFADPAVRILHRDIKPENILIDEKTGVARIADFGISRVIDRSTGIVTVAGSLPYMDPECYEQRAGVTSDFYSLGVVMYEISTGELPFENFHVRRKRPAVNPRELHAELPEELARIILKTLERDVTQRYREATELLADLRRLSAALNPLPPQYTRVGDLGAGRLLCEDTTTRERVTVHLVETDVPLADLEAEAARITALASPGIIGPRKLFRTEHIVGTVSPAPRSTPLMEKFGSKRVESAAAQQALCESMIAVGELLERAHAAGIVHGCLAPQLICFDRAGAPEIHGFGLAPILRTRRWPDKAFADARPAMSPRVASRVDGPSSGDDAFALGALIYHVLTQEWPAIGGGAAPDPRRINSLVTRRFAAAVQRALESERNADLHAMLDALRQCRWPDDLVDTLTADALEKYEQGDPVAAYELLDKGLYEDPGNPRLHLTRGVIYLREKEYKWAAHELQTAARIEPTREVFIHLGHCYAAWDYQYDKACEMFSRALEFGPDAEVERLLEEAGRERASRG